MDKKNKEEKSRVKQDIFEAMFEEEVTILTMLFEMCN